MDSYQHKITSKKLTLTNFNNFYKCRSLKIFNLSFHALRSLLIHQIAKQAGLKLQKCTFTDEGIFLNSPEEVTSAKYLALPTETFVCKIAITVTTPDAFRVPCSVQYVQQKFVQNWLLTTGTCDDHCGGGGRCSRSSTCNNKGKKYMKFIQ